MQPDTPATDKEAPESLKGFGSLKQTDAEHAVRRSQG
jgi:hypothetical protein